MGHIPNPEEQMLLQHILPLVETMPENKRYEISIQKIEGESPVVKIGIGEISTSQIPPHIEALLDHFFGH